MSSWRGPVVRGQIGVVSFNLKGSGMVPVPVVIDSNPGFGNPEHNQRQLDQNDRRFKILTATDASEQNKATIITRKV